MASRSLGYGRSASIAVCTTAMTSPASAPIMAKPRIRSSLPATRAFMNPCVSSVVSVRRTALVGSLGHPHGDALAPRVAFGQSDAGERRLREHAVRNQPITCAAVRPGQIVPDDPKVVPCHVCELGATGAFPDGPDPGRTRLEPLVDADVATIVQLDAGHLEPDPGGVRSAPRCDQDVAALDVSLAGGRAHNQADFVPGSAVHMEDLGLYEKVDAFVTEHPLHLLRDVGILTTHELRPTLDDRDAAAEVMVRLAQFETDVAAAEHDQMRRYVVELESLDIGERLGSLEGRHARESSRAFRR